MDKIKVCLQIDWNKLHRTEVFFKKVFLKISQNSQENTRTGVFFSDPACNFIKKETPAGVISCDFCEFFQNIPFY